MSSGAPIFGKDFLAIPVVTKRGDRRELFVINTKTLRGALPNGRKSLELAMGRMGFRLTPHGKYILYRDDTSVHVLPETSLRLPKLPSARALQGILSSLHARSSAMGLDRRDFLKASAAQAALIGVGVTGCATHPGAPGIETGTNPFRHGVASGDPLADRVILWTRVSPEIERAGLPIEVDWWIARDPQGRDRVVAGRTLASPSRDYTIKIDASELAPLTDYHYGFAVANFASPVGRTRTLPRGAVDRVRLAFASCANYPGGYFNAYAAIARRDDLDVVLHLGDYIYEYASRPSGDGPTLGPLSNRKRLPTPISEASGAVSRPIT